ncbi:Rap1a/Tai family immunity protein [Pseudomonas sp. W2Oct36]|uniref:Rap1a/Tai family immunity protein n=1 Tax=Pseudomonas sp. W2Oct36 TaxID=1215284 RepID=UPI0034E0D963
MPWHYSGSAWHGFHDGRYSPKKYASCLPKSGVKGQQAIRVTVKFLEANPKLLNDDASMLILLALTDAFPCQ